MDTASFIEGVESISSYMHERILGLAGDIQGGSLLVVDKGFGELFEAGIGVQTLLDLGAVGIVTLAKCGGDDRRESWISTLSCLTKQNRFSNVLVFCSSLLLNCVDDVVEFANILPGYTDRITVFSMVSDAAHHDADPHLYSENNCFQQLEKHFHIKIMESTGEDFHVKIKHVDIPCLMVGKGTFVFPRCCGASFLPQEQPTGVPVDIQAKIMMNAHMISSVSRILDVQPEAFCLGALSERVARALSFIPAHDSSSGKRAAFCIIDRALDTMSPSIHSDYFIQKMMVQNYESQGNAHLTVRNSVFHPADVGSMEYVDFLMSKTDKEAMLFIRKWLKEAIRESKMKFLGRLKPGAPSVEDLEALSAVLSSDPGASKKYASLLQIVELACECLKNDTVWQESKKLEEIARLTAEDGPDSLCNFILDELVAAGRCVSESHSILMTVKYLLIGSYWMKMHPDLQGNSSLSVMQRTSIASALAEESAKCMLAWQDKGEFMNKVEIEMPWIPKEMMNVITESRGDMSSVPLLEVCTDVVETICNLPSQYQASDNQSTSREQALIIKCIDDILAGRDIAAMKHVGTSIAGLLKSGLGRIGLQRHHPGEYEMIVIFVLGGISINEISQTRAYIDRGFAQLEAEGRQMPQIILGASSILTTPEITLRSIFS